MIIMVYYVILTKYIRFGIWNLH